MVALCSKVQKTENIDASQTPIFETDFYYQKRKRNRKASMKRSMAKTTQSLVYKSDEIYDPWSWPMYFCNAEKANTR